MKKAPLKDFVFWVRLVGGVLLLSFGLIMAFNVGTDDTPGFSQKMVIGITGAIILIYAIYRVFGLIKTLTEKWSKILCVIEIVLDLVVGVMLLSGGFNFSDKMNDFTAFMVKYFRFFLGGVLYVRGIIYAITTIFFKEPTDVKFFVANIACLTVGVFLAAKDDFKVMGLAILFTVFAIGTGVFFITEGGVNYYRYRKAYFKKQEKNEKLEEIKEKEDIKEISDDVNNSEVNIPLNKNEEEITDNTYTN